MCLRPTTAAACRRRRRRGRAGARTSFNVIAAEVHYANPTEHGLSGQPRLLDDDFATLEAVGFPTSGEAYVRVESAAESPELRA